MITIKEIDTKNWTFDRLMPFQKSRMRNKVLNLKPKNKKEAEKLLIEFSYDFLCNEDLMSFKEISEKLNLPTRTVISIFYRGMKKIEKIIKERNLEL